MNKSISLVSTLWLIISCNIVSAQQVLTASDSLYAKLVLLQQIEIRDKTDVYTILSDTCVNFRFLEMTDKESNQKIDEYLGIQFVELTVNSKFCGQAIRCIMAKEKYSGTGDWYRIAGFRYTDIASVPLDYSNLYIEGLDLECIEKWLKNEKHTCPCLKVSLCTDIFPTGIQMPRKSDCKYHCSPFYIFEQKSK